MGALEQKEKRIVMKPEHNPTARFILLSVKKKRTHHLATEHNTLRQSGKEGALVAIGIICTVQETDYLPKNQIEQIREKRKATEKLCKPTQEHRNLREINLLLQAYKKSHKSQSQTAKMYHNEFDSCTRKKLQIDTFLTLTGKKANPDLRGHR